MNAKGATKPRAKKGEIELSNRSTKQMCWIARSKAEWEKNARRRNRNNEKITKPDKAKIAKQIVQLV